MDKLNFDATENSSAFIEKTEQIQTAVRATAQELERLEQKLGESFQQMADDANTSADIVENAIKNMQEQINIAISSLSKLNAENQVRLTNLQNESGKSTGEEGARKEPISKEISSRENLSADINNQFKELVQLNTELSNFKQKVAENKNSVYEGITSGLDGLSGAFTAATSMLKMFSIENESLSNIMEKVQLAITITNGLQEVNTALSKDSAFQINIVGRLKSWWKAITLQAAAAQGVETAAAATGTVVNHGLAVSFRAIGLAIKSIPVIGWILTGITALIGLYSLWSSGTEEQKEKQDEMNQSVKEFNEGIQNYAAKPVAMIELLSTKFKALGDDMNAQKKFVIENKKVFDELGVSINSVKDAQQLLINNKDKFIKAQIDKAISLAYMDKVNEAAKIYVKEVTAADYWKKEAEKENASDTVKGNGTSVRKKVKNISEYETLLKEGLINEDGSFLRPSEVKEKVHRNKAEIAYSDMALSKEQVILYSEQSDKIMSEIVPQKKTSDPQKEDNTKQVEEAHKRHMALLAQQELERTRFVEDSVYRIQQAEIDALADGPKKTFKQLELNQKKEEQSLKHEKQELIRKRIEEKKAIFDAAEQLAKANDSTHEIKEFVPPAVILTKLEKQEFKDRTDYLDTKHKNERLAYYESERQSMDEYLKDYKTFIEKREAIIALGKQKTDGKKEDEQKIINEGTLKSLSDLDIKAAESSSAFGQLFSNVKERSVKDMRTVIDEARRALNFIKDGNWDSGIGMEFGISQESFEALKNSPEEISKIEESIQDLTVQADAGDTALKKLVISFEHLFAAGADSEDIKNALGEIEDALNEVMQSAQFFSNALSSLGDTFGIGAFSSIAEGLNIAIDATNATISGAKAGAIFGPIGAAAGAAIGLVSSLGSAFTKFHDAKHEKEIQRIQEQIEVLETSYRNLGDSLDKAFSKDASNLIKQQNTLLEQQKVLIRNQIAEEKDKKSADGGKIKGWENQIAEIDKVIAGNKEKMIDVVFGEDLKSAINDFAEAYANAWNVGDDRAKSSKDLVKDMIKQMITEAIKAASSGPMEKLRKKLAGFFSDNVISAWEREQIEKDAESIMNDLDRQFGWADEYMKGEEEATSQSSEQKGFAAMSQETGDELNGRFTALQISNEEIKNSMFFILGNLSSLCVNTSNGNLLLTEMRNLAIMSNGHLEDIAKYTKVMLGFGEKLDNIAYNTKSLTAK